jgi:kumamolisin
MSEERVVLPDSQRGPKAGAERVAEANPEDEVELTLTLRGPELPGPEASTDRPLDVGSFAQRYGTDPSDAAAVQSELENFGLTVSDVSLPTRTLHARGTVAQIESAFGVKLGTYRSADQGEFRGRAGPIEIPSSLAGIVTGVFGLDDRRVARRGSSTTASPTLALGPSDLERRYQFPSGDAAGQVIAIAEFGGSYFPDDLQSFCTKYDRPVPKVTSVPLGVPVLTLAQIQKLPVEEQNTILGESVEVMMDAEIIASLCSGAEVYVYFAPFTEKGWVDLIDAVITAKPVAPTALSISWGLAEDSPDWSKAALNEINQRIQAASMLGITVCAAAGDDGAGDQINDGHAHVNFPASSPFVLSVGGTMIDPTSQSEVVWWQKPGDRAGGGGSTGGGVSVIFPRPTWQTVDVKSLNADSIDGRVIPDICALAGPPYYDLIFLEKDSPNGGTSAATPLWASLLARISSGLPEADQRRFVTPLLFQQGPGGKPIGQTGCTDITAGSNPSPGLPTGYVSGPGYDAVSGWGSPLGTKLQQLL